PHMAPGGEGELGPACLGTAFGIAKAPNFWRGWRWLPTAPAPAPASATRRRIDLPTESVDHHRPFVAEEPVAVLLLWMFSARHHGVRQRGDETVELPRRCVHRR